MRLLDILPPERCVADFRAADKTALIDGVATLLAVGDDDAVSLKKALHARERLGTTGLGLGVAIPHGRSDQLSEARAAFVRLAQPIDFDAADGRPVDLVASLVVPAHFTDQHLKLLAELAELFSDGRLTDELRAAPDSAALRSALGDWFTRKV